MTNKNLNAAKKAKNDEFYTRLEDIEKELIHYTKHFKGKVVYCNCDDPTWSNFWRYFYRHFDILGTTANGLVSDDLKLPWPKKHNNPFINGKPKYARILIKNKHPEDYQNDL